MNNKFFLLTILLLAFTCNAADDFNGNGKKRVVLTNTTPVPRPHAFEVDDPVAMYVVSTQFVEITFDSSYYTDYIVNVEGAYAAMQYAVTSPTMYIPTATLGNVVDIYIESNDYGSYYGVLDKTAFSSME